MPDVDVAASSPATAAPPPAAPVEEYQTPDLSTLSGEQYQKWRQTGEAPAVAPKPADSAPAKDAAPKGETAPATDPEPKVEEPKKAKGAEARKEQLHLEVQEALRERREALRQLEEVRATLARERGDKSATPAASSEPIGEPLLKDFLENAETYEAGQQEFQRAHSQWAIEQHEAKRQAAEQERTVAEQREAFAQRVEKDAVGIEDYDAVMAGAKRLTPTSAMWTAFYESEMPGKLIYHLAKNPQEFARIAALSPAKSIIALGKIEEGLLSPKNGTPAPPLKPIQHSNAPPPPTELAARNMAPADESEAALEEARKGDPGAMRRWMSLENAKDLKKLRGT